MVYDPTLNGCTPKEFIQNQIIYIDGLMNFLYLQEISDHGHANGLNVLVGVGNERIWKLFEGILKFAKWVILGKMGLQIPC